jgi:hypothetical protein
MGVRIGKVLGDLIGFEDSTQGELASVMLDQVASLRQLADRMVPSCSNTICLLNFAKLPFCQLS